MPLADDFVLRKFEQFFVKFFLPGFFISGLKVALNSPRRVSSLTAKDVYTPTESSRVQSSPIRLTKTRQ